MDAKNERSVHKVKKLIRIISNCFEKIMRTQMVSVGECNPAELCFGLQTSCDLFNLFQHMNISNIHPVEMIENLLDINKEQMK